jgi:hypothetical protein
MDAWYRMSSTTHGSVAHLCRRVPQTTASTHLHILLGLHEPRRGISRLQSVPADHDVPRHRNTAALWGLRKPSRTDSNTQTRQLSERSSDILWIKDVPRCADASASPCAVMRPHALASLRTIPPPHFHCSRVSQLTYVTPPHVTPRFRFPPGPLRPSGPAPGIRPPGLGLVQRAALRVAAEKAVDHRPPGHRLVWDQMR